MTKTATVTAETTAIHHTGRGFRLPAGTYEFVDIDGAVERGVAYLAGPEDGALVCVSLTDHNIDFKGAR
ncbi:hypothetical protein GCM10010399_64110 [Dactylosporangium fulvum]|uniref:Uncharacterized protein n=1 Tax=Dactylosporangium fulvum TaxID=53359 RepID=A0ABY5WCD1_9ACTN|nr:hypothetical protein [Dactylosporangium fulvum]UWP85766.1 hypothetical protein Dfulv_16600 [Dactylosporangium fulvum]